VADNRYGKEDPIYLEINKNLKIAKKNVQFELDMKPIGKSANKKN